MISKDQVRELAWLSRIELTDSELDSYAPQIEKIISYLNELEDVPVVSAEVSSAKKHVAELRKDNAEQYDGDPLGTKYRKDGFVKGPRMV